MVRRTQQARTLRQRQTDSERVLWFRLRDRRLRGLKFRRQAPVDGFIVDFLCAQAHLIIEIDGGQHATGDETERTQILESAGCLVLRFWSNDVLSNIDGVLAAMFNTLDHAEPPHPDPLPVGPKGERESARTRGQVATLLDKSNVYILYYKQIKLVDDVSRCLFPTPGGTPSPRGLRHSRI